jgi:hypothetical protein
VLFLLIGIAAIGAFAIPAIIDAVDSVEKSIDDATPDVSTPSDRPGARDGKPRKAARPPQGLQRASLLRRGNLAPALARLKRMTGSSRVQLVRLDAQRIIVTVALGGSRTRLAQATWDGQATVLSTSPSGATGRTFTWSQINASAPNRIVRAATRGRGAKAFDYVVLIDAAGLRWSAFLKNGRGTFQAQPDGSGVIKVG